MDAKIIAKPSKSPSMSPPPPPPPPPPPKWVTRQVTTVCRSSVTLEEIARFWRRKKMEEEDHLLAAQKAAARIRARNLTEEDYKRFEESLKDSMEEKKNEESISKDDGSKELRVGIKDWWTKSKYAYLNQPAIQSMAHHHPHNKRASTYIPNMCLFQAPPAQSAAFLGFCR